MNTFGDKFAVNRFYRYANLQWNEHSKYKGFMIERCYDGSQPKACYRAIDEKNDTVIVGEGLYQCKSAITRYLEAKA